MQNALACVAYKSAVDVTKLDFNTFLAIYQPILVIAYGSNPEKLEDMITQAENIYKRFINMNSHTVAGVNPALSLNWRQQGTVRAYSLLLARRKSKMPVLLRLLPTLKKARLQKQNDSTLFTLPLINTSGVTRNQQKKRVNNVLSLIYCGNSVSSSVASTGTSREASTLSMRTVPAGALRMGLTWRTSAY